MLFDEGEQWLLCWTIRNDSFENAKGHKLPFMLVYARGSKAHQYRSLMLDAVPSPFVQVSLDELVQ